MVFKLEGQFSEVALNLRLAASLGGEGGYVDVFVCSDFLLQSDSESGWSCAFLLLKGRGLGRQVNYFYCALSWGNVLQSVSVR